VGEKKEVKKGRPRKEIDKKNFENLCSLQCTLEEIAGFFDCCEDTIENWCKREYDMLFSDVFKIKRQKGKISLRRNQFRLAEKNANMAIWLGKQYLDQKDKTEVSGVAQVIIVDDMDTNDENIEIGSDTD